MSKQITRTVKSWNVIIKNTKSEIIEEYITFDKPNFSKIATNRIKETGSMNFTIDIGEIEEQRTISLKDFIKYSTVIID